MILQAFTGSYSCSQISSISPTFAFPSWHLISQQCEHWCSPQPSYSSKSRPLHVALKGVGESSMAFRMRSASINHAAAAWELAFAEVKLHCSLGKGALLKMKMEAKQFRQPERLLKSGKIGFPGLGQWRRRGLNLWEADCRASGQFKNGIWGALLQRKSHRLNHTGGVNEGESPTLGASFKEK